EYQQRFPSFAPRLQLLFEVHQAIASAQWLGGEPAPGAGADPATTPTFLEPEVLSPSGSSPGTPAIPGYEILGVLGHGGMGVVYRARHIQLHRVVALKIIRAGAHASPEEVSRFRAEAEAVARLQDPNIVQIYELGEHAGCPYLALEFVDGGSLADRVNGKPLSPRQAAELTLSLARGVHSAHERGVIHRDLKPANVLL